MALFSLSRIKEQDLWRALTFLTLSVSLLFSFISISILQIFLFLAFIFWVIRLIRKEEKIAFPLFFWPLAAYAGLSLLSSVFSRNPEISFKDSKELLLFLVVPIFYTAYSRKEEFTLTNLALLTSALVSTFYSFYYYIFLSWPGERIMGFMGHYMTQAGLLVLFSSLALSLIFFSKGKSRIIWGLGFILSSVALVLTLTRSAWIGLGFALCVVLLLWRPKSLILVPVIAGFIFVVSPQAVKKRILSIFSLKGYSNMERIEYLRAGIKIIKDFPLLGTGPDTVDMVFQNPKYGLGEIAKRNVHLHNNFIQIAAERGIPALLVWLSFLIWTFILLVRLLKNKDPSLYPLTVGGLAALAALVAAGFFEYNFADSEITTLFLYLETLPFALHRLLKKS